jgi:hypothetical protein
LIAPFFALFKAILFWRAVVGYVLRSKEKKAVPRTGLVKQKIIGLIFSGKLVFQNNSYQTTPYNLVIQRICSLGKDFRGQKKNLACNFASQSYRVTPPGFKPGTF